ncbi:MAG TPA: M23 family metallopeptidase [Acidimicrobiales bacterium]|nr:M23 family metallopeptidase [Acidimicrobiales bacterium]
MALAAFCLVVPATSVALAAGSPAGGLSPHATGPATADTTPPTTAPTLPTARTTSTTSPGLTTSTTGTDTTATSDTTTTTSTDAGSSTSTTGGSDNGGATSGTSGSGPAPGPGGGSGGGAGTGSPAAGSPAPADPRLQSVAADVPRTGGSTTWPLLTALSPLTHYGLSQLQTALVGFGSFPVAGPAYYTDDWLEYRSTPTPHLHQGIDIVAPSGTPIRAPTDGDLTYSNSDPDGYGLTAIVTQPDRTTFVMAHMSATVLGLATGAQVKTGQVVGFVGATGDATGPHCHFEVHPRGGAGIDGKSLLDRWIAQALAGAPGLVAAFADPGSSAAEPQVVTVPDSVPIAPLNRARGQALSRAGVLHGAGAPPVPVRFGGVVVGLGVAGLAGWSIVRRRRSAVSTA